MRLQLKNLRMLRAYVLALNRMMMKNSTFVMRYLAMMSQVRIQMILILHMIYILRINMYGMVICEDSAPHIL